LLIFSTVNLVAYKRSADVKSKKSITLLGVILCGIATLVLIVQQFNTNMLGVLIALGIIATCFLVEWIYKRKEKNNLQSDS
jgi:uncharacterized membrane protein YfcA